MLPNQELDGLQSSRVESHPAGGFGGERRAELGVIPSAALTDVVQ
jgi:hypothetical protein